MTLPAPHFLLFSHARRAPRSQTADEALGQWHFVLESVAGDIKLEAEDFEREPSAERLELLAVVRGLEALDQPSRVTLVTPSRYVAHGLRHGLPQWRDNDWQWERFGQWQPVKNHDLWQRLDLALQFHEVECKAWQADHRSAAPTTVTEEPQSAALVEDVDAGEEIPVIRHRRPTRRGRRLRFDQPARPAGSTDLEGVPREAAELRWWARAAAFLRGLWRQEAETPPPRAARPARVRCG